MSHDAWISQSAERKIDPHKHVGDERKRLLQEDALLIKDGCNIMLDHPSFMDHSLFRCQSVAVHKVVSLLDDCQDVLRSGKKKADGS